MYLHTAIATYMQYMVQLTTLLVAIMSLVLVLNIVINPYNGHNRRIRKSLAQLRGTARTGKIIPFVKSVPREYKVQWHCYTTARNTMASDMFVAIPSKSTFYGWWLFLVGSVLAIFNIVMAVVVGHKVAVIVGGGYILLLCPLILMCCGIKKLFYLRAVKKYKTYVALIDAYFGKGDVEVDRQYHQREIRDTIKQIGLVSNSHDMLDRMKNILASQPNTAERTVKQQQAINLALNKLMINQ